MGLGWVTATASDRRTLRAMASREDKTNMRTSYVGFHGELAN
jgi:hypothetical protein